MNLPVPARACLMCGTPNAACLLQTRDTRKACCGVCADSDTHPAAARDRDMTCAQWAMIHGAPTKPHSEASLLEIERFRKKLRGEA